MKNWLKNNAYFGVIMWAILVCIDIVIEIPRYIYIPLSVVILIIFFIQIWMFKIQIIRKMNSMGI